MHVPSPIPTCLLGLHHQLSSDEADRPLLEVKPSHHSLAPTKPSLAPHPLQTAAGTGLITARVALVTLRIIAIIFSILQIRNEHHQTVQTRDESRNIRQPSNVPSVPSASPGRTTCGPIFAPTRMRDLLCVQSVGKHSHDNTIASDTKDCTLERRSLFAAGLCRAPRNGVAAGDSHALMRSVVISDPRLVGSVSNLFWMKKRPTGRRSGWQNNSKRNSRLG